MTRSVLTANHLLSGEAVFLTEGELWSPHIDDALAVEDSDGKAWLEAAGARSVAAQVVVEPYLIDVEAQGPSLVPVRFRERLRTLGPTVRPDLGKQAEAA